MKPLIQLEAIHKTYRTGTSRVQVLAGAGVKVEQGEFVAVIGASGSGKSTLLHIAGALDRPDSGQVLFGDEDLEAISFWRRNEIRNRSFGFVFQFYNLLPELNVLENVMLPAMVSVPMIMMPFNPRPKKKQAKLLLEEFGLGQRLDHLPAQLSGGERQRVAIARALINEPALLLADEPTGNLDGKTGRDILNVIMRLHKQGNQSILLVTHDPQVASLADRIIELREGQIVAANLARMKPDAL